VTQGLALRPALEHRPGGVEMAEGPLDVEVLGMDRIDEGMRHPEPRVDLCRVLGVAELLIERQCLFQVGDLAVEVAHNNHQLR
jgi:hypothetical protein